MRLSEVAEADLADIWCYLAREASPAVATGVIINIERRFDEVLLFPRSGAPREELAPRLRVILEGNYAVYYLPDANEIIIVRVIHAARDMKAIAEHGGFKQ